MGAERCATAVYIGPQDVQAVGLWNGAALHALRRPTPAPEEFARLMEASDAAQ